MTASIRTIAATIAALWLCSQGPAQAIDCRRAKTRVENLICTNPVLKRQDSEMETAFAQRILRAGTASAEIRKSQARWVADRDAACVTNDKRIMARCLDAQYRMRMQVLAAMRTGAAEVVTGGSSTAAPAEQAPATSVSPGLPPGVYLSEAVELTLRPGGSFLLQQLGGSRQASGEYAVTDSVITFKTGEGDVGKTQFPLRCNYLETSGGFAVYLGQAGCRPFAGLFFKETGGAIREVPP